jgi:hypothetical protein
MHARRRERLVQLWPIGSLAGFNFGKLGNDAAVAAVEVARNGRALGLDPEPAAPLESPLLRF